MEGLFQTVIAGRVNSAACAFTNSRILSSHHGAHLMAPGQQHLGDAAPDCADRARGAGHEDGGIVS